MKRFRITPTQVIALGFASVICIGAILLMLPISQKSSESLLSPVDAFFTAVSAVCVTGLLAVDTADTFTVFGQTIIAILIQIGGLGITSIGVGLISFRNKKIRMKDQMLLREALNYSSMNGVLNLIRSVLITTFIFEFIGAILSFMVFSRDYPIPHAIGISIFHSIASFNNAGFDILGNMQSLTNYSDNIPLNIITSGLIIFGGLGFFVIQDILKKHSWKKFKVHTKIVICMTITLIIGGTILLKISEHNSITWLQAFFTSVSTRTAGFSTCNFSSFSNAGILIMTLCMFIGAAPGSTGGGIKVTTIFVLLRSILSYPTGSTPKAFHRRFSSGASQQAFVICTLGIGIVLISTFALSLAAPEYEFSQIIFESISAFATVGLSTGITPELNDAAKIILMITMYAGRLGALSIISLWAKKKIETILLPEEEIAIG